MSQVASPDWFVVYQGDSPIAVGTAYECANQTGLSVQNVWNIATPSRHKRIAAVPLTDQLLAVRVRPEELA